jgi:hypothetical protein
MSDLIGRRRARPLRIAARLRACEGGIAFVEFAMALPILVAFALCGLECANYAMAHLRVANIAMLTADNASRVRDAIDEANIIEIMTGAKMAGDGIDFRQNGRIILSSMERNSAGSGGASTGQWFRWQRCDGARAGTASAYGAQGKGQNDATLQFVGTGANQIAAASGTAVMVVEVTYTYQPIVSDAIIGARTIRYEQAFNVRQRVNQALTNTSGLNAAQIRTCNHVQA